MLATAQVPWRAVPLGGRHLCAVMAWIVLVLASGWAMMAQEGGSGAGPAPSEEGTLALQQTGLADRYTRLEKLLFDLSALEAAENPRRAALLKQAFQQSADKLTRRQLENVAQLLVRQDYGRAVDEQGVALQDLKQLLELLQSENRPDRLRSEQERIREYIKELDRLIRLQGSVQGRTEGGVDMQRLVEEQARVAERAADLARKIQEAEEPRGEGDSRDGESGEAETGEGESGEGESGRGESQSGERGSPSPGEGESGSESSEGMPGDGQQGAGESSENGEGGESDRDPTSQPSEGEEGRSEEGGDPSEQPGEPGESGESGENGTGEPSSGEGDPGEGQAPGEAGEGESSGESGEAPENGEPGSPGEGSPSGDMPPGDSEGGDPGDGGPSAEESPSPQENPARKRIQAAEDRMRDAQRKLEEAKRSESLEDQEKAREELMKAKAELEEILRQMREEEVERMLSLLESRFRRMLEMQIKVFESTKRLDRTAAEERGRDFVILANNLSGEERKISLEAERALLLLQEEGSSIAFPESVDQIRREMDRVTDLLAKGNVGLLTQEAQEDIIAALEEMIEALQQAQRDQEERQEQQQQQQQQQAGSEDPPLVDQLAELRMIRALQMRVNTRTERFARLLQDADDPVGQAEDEELIDALEHLSGRESRILQITRDILLEKNK